MYLLLLLLCVFHIDFSVFAHIVLMFLSCFIQFHSHNNFHGEFEMSMRILDVLQDQRPANPCCLFFGIKFSRQLKVGKVVSAEPELCAIILSWKHAKCFFFISFELFPVLWIHLMQSLLLCWLRTHFELPTSSSSSCSDVYELCTRVSNLNWTLFCLHPSLHFRVDSSELDDFFLFWSWWISCARFVVHTRGGFVVSWAFAWKTEASVWVNEVESEERKEGNLWERKIF